MRYAKKHSWINFYIIMTALMLVIASALVFGTGSSDAMNEAGPVPQVAESPDDNAALSPDEQAEKILNQMTLTEKIGQMVMIGVHGTDVNDDILYMLHQFHIGGVIFFDRNMESIEQVSKFTKNLQEQCNEKIPMFIAVDEEGGDVVRMEHALTPPPSQQEIGGAGDVSAATQWAKRTAKSLRAMGINTNFAPVADVGSPDTRSYGTDASVVTDFVRGASKGYVEENLFFCLKHFPGIGKWKVDSHQDISEINVTLDELVAENLVPFRTMIKEHNPADYFIMVSHLKYPALDEDHPASLSPAIMKELLRNQIGYEGIIITDDMEMGAVSRYNGFREVGAKAVQAGADIVLVCHEYPHEEDAYMGILDAVKSGKISEERINESVKRILRAKLAHLSGQ